MAALTKYFAGADIGHKFIDICIIGQPQNSDLEKKPLFECRIENKLNHFRAFIKDLRKLNDKLGGDCIFHLAMEATGTYYLKFVTCLASEAEGLVVPYVVNPCQIKATGEVIKAKNKTDKQDALKIASYIRFAHTEPNVHPWELPSPEMEELRQLAHLYEDTRELIRAEKNRIHAIEQSPNMSMPTAKIRLDRIKYLEAQLEEIKKKMEDHIKKNPRLKEQADLLRSIPGIGKISSALLLCEIGDVERFKNKKTFTAFAGIVPSEFQSGSSINKPARITKKGSKRIRRNLYMPAMVAIKWNPLIRDFYLKLKARGKKGKSALIAAMKKLLQIIYGVLKTGQPFNPAYEIQRAA